MRSFRTRSRAGFGSISRRERYQADVFYADLTGSAGSARRRRPPRAAEADFAREWEEITTLPFAEERA